MNKEDIKFLKDLKKLRSAGDDEVKKIYLLYRQLINDEDKINEYQNCNCPSIIRDMAFELVIYYQKNKQKLSKI